MGAVSAYQAGGAHRHIPEIEQALAEVMQRANEPAWPGRDGVSFTPVLAPMSRGILATCTARLRRLPRSPAGTPGRPACRIPAGCGRRWRDAYAGEPFVTCCRRGSWPSTAAVAGSNAVHLQAAADLRAGRAIVVAAIDNLGKGAAGQAVQNANLMLGLAETAGLSGVRSGAMSVTAPAGFRAAGLAAGIKASGSPDLAVVLNDGPSDAAAGVFTSNRVKAAPVLWTQQVVSGGRVRAVVLNSGCANACTGPAGFQDTHSTASGWPRGLRPAGQVAVCSTGLIGERLPMDKLLPGVDAAVAAATAAAAGRRRRRS